MAELVQVSGRGEVAPPAQLNKGWPRTQRLVLIGGAAVLGGWLAISPNPYAAVACLLLTLVYSSRIWPKMVRFVLCAAIPNNLIWASFLLLRGLGDASPITPSVRLYARRAEVWLFGGEMPSSVLQRHLFEPGHLRPWDYFFLFVHASFFLVPSIFFIGLWWSDRARFRRYIAALILTLAMGVVCFWFLPSNPPWMNPANGDTNPVPVARINSFAAGSLGITSFGEDGHLAAETNSLAAMPSIHLAVTFLCWMAWRVRRPWSYLAAINLILMTFSLVYLGEHHVIDEVAGVALALIAWRVAPAVVAGTGAVVGPRLATVCAAAAERSSASSRRLRAKLGFAD